ncbi:hypothetical protein BHE74_00032099 [Ensete ventricosum]|nr:hypothetical protein BHE74_00032099 [Ensete ventricosum]
MGTRHVGMGLESTTPHVLITSSPTLLFGARLQIWSHERTHGSVEEDFHLLLPYASLEMIVSWIRKILWKARAPSGSQQLAMVRPQVLDTVDDGTLERDAREKLIIVRRMAQSHRLPSLLCLIAVAIMAHTVRAQNSPQDFLDAARDSVGVGPMSWDDGVAAYANQRRADCQLFHSGGTYDENLFKGGASRRLVGVGCVVALGGGEAVHRL